MRPQPAAPQAPPPLQPLQPRRRSWGCPQHPPAPRPPRPRGPPPPSRSSSRPAAPRGPRGGLSPQGPLARPPPSAARAAPENRLGLLRGQARLPGLLRPSSSARPGGSGYMRTRWPPPPCPRPPTWRRCSCCTGGTSFSSSSWRLRYQGACRRGACWRRWCWAWAPPCPGIVRRAVCPRSSYSRPWARWTSPGCSCSSSWWQGRGCRMMAHAGQDEERGGGGMS